MEMTKTERLLAALKRRREERVNLYINLCSTENKVNALAPIDPLVYGRMLCSDLRNHLVEMNEIDLEIEKAVCELLKKRSE